MVACTDSEVGGGQGEPKVSEGLDKDSAAVCRFDRHSAKGTEQSKGAWYLLRSKDRVESFDETASQIQIWEKDQEGRVSELRVFRDEKLVLEISNGDLLASGELPRWSTVWSVVDRSDLEHDNQKIGVRPSALGEIEEYRGLDEGLEIRVEWSSRLELPVSMKQSSSKGVDEVRLVGCWAPLESEVHGTSQEQLLDYRHIDFSDLGDMESDPQIQRISKLLGHSHEDEAHSH